LIFIKKYDIIFIESKGKGMIHMTKDIEGMTEKLFAASVFDPSYMDAEYAKSQFRKALAALTDEEYEYIVKLMEEE
jgi:hypothetical protein